MAMGDSGVALRHGAHDRHAFSDSLKPLKIENPLMGDGGFAPVCCVSRQSCSPAFVGDGQELSFQVGDAVLCEVGFASRSCSSNAISCYETSRVNDTAYIHPHSFDGFTAFINGDDQQKAEVGYGDQHTLCNRFEDCSDVGNDHEAIHGSHDSLTNSIGAGECQDVGSPRLSFSCDFAMVDISTGVSNDRLYSSQSSSPRLSPEKRKWEQQKYHSSEFAFSQNESACEGNHNYPEEGRMLSADELFFNGKLLPLPYLSSRTSYDDLCLPSTSKLNGNQPAVNLLSSNMDVSKPLVRHLSLECAKTDFVSCVASPPSSSPTSILSPAGSPSYTFSASPSSKYSLKFKEMFKLKKVSGDNLSNSELVSEGSVASTCRLPISPRSLWPFSRNGSASESKADTSPCCRKISNKECNSVSSDFVGSTLLEGPDGREDADSSKITSVTVQANTHEDVRERIRPSLALMPRDRGSRSDVCKTRASATRNFSRGSPGRRRGQTMSTGAKANANKIMLRNLERCSAEKKLGLDGWKGLNKKSPYPDAFKVAPILNVAVYKGGSASKNGFFSFGSLFSSKKKKKKPMEVAINWRKGA